MGHTIEESYESFMAYLATPGRGIKRESSKPARERYTGRRT